MFRPGFCRFCSSTVANYSVSVKQHYAMRALWIAFCACLTCSDAIRESVVESVVGNATVLGLGDQCNCWMEPLEKKTCCGHGLICSRSSGKCKLALKAACEGSWFGTNCAARADYQGGDIGCHKLLGIRSAVFCFCFLASFISGKLLSRHVTPSAGTRYYADGQKRCCVPGVPFGTDTRDWGFYVAIKDKAGNVDKTTCCSGETHSIYCKE